MVEEFNIAKFNRDKKREHSQSQRHLGKPRVDMTGLGYVERMGGATAEKGAAPRGQRYKKGGQTKWLD